MSLSLTRRANPTKIYRYVFAYSTHNRPADWPPTHTADVVPFFLHRNLSGKDHRVSETFADRLLESATGRDPALWTRYTADEAQLNVLGKAGE